MIINLEQEATRLAEKIGLTPEIIEVLLTIGDGAITLYQSCTAEIALQARRDYADKQHDKLCAANPDWEPLDYEEQLAQRESAEYLQGQRDVETWREDKQLFGTAAAEQMQLAREYDEY
tara:strand:+ start:256 stop:612 length:357 start_codon:yes stop_codon:yes gene_type:complete